jgi:hypothetical protein
MAPSTTLTRDALFAAVWKTPMTRLARDFGISDVALAKICKKLDVPIPGRGHWARVAAGQRVRVPRLPKARADTRPEFTITERTPRSQTEKMVPPAVSIGESLARAHPAVRRLSGLLDGREPDREKTLYLRGDSEATVRLSQGTKRRALLILDVVLKNLETRGHVVTFEVPTDTWSPHHLHVKVGAETLKLFISESLTRTAHKLTAKEDADRVRYGSTYAPKYDFNPSGRLSLRARGTYATSRRWSDGSRQRLEGVLGEVVVGIEEVARRTAEKRAALQESWRRQAEEQRRRETGSVLENYERALVSELDEAVEGLRRADAIRELVRSVGSAPISPAKETAVRSWLAWAKAWADSIDPRTHPMGVVRVVSPDAAAMTDDEFRYWRDWPDSEKRAGTYGPRLEPHGA